MAIQVEAKETAGLDAGVYEGEIVEMIEESGDYGDQIKFILEIDSMTQSNGDYVKQWAWASKTLSPKSKLWKWVKAVTGQTPTIGGTFDVEQALLNQRVQFTVSINEGGRSVVTDIFKAKSAPAAAPRPAAAAAPGQQAEEAALTCAFPKCGRPAFSYDDDGNAQCPKHGGNPE